MAKHLPKKKKCNFEANLATGRTLFDAPLLALVFDILRETVELYSVKGPIKLEVLESVCYLVLVSSRECLDALAIPFPSGVTWGESPRMRHNDTHGGRLSNRSFGMKLDCSQSPIFP